MNDEKAKQQTACIDLEFDLDALPEKVWRAISIPEIWESWFPKDALIDTESAVIKPGEEVRYRMRDDAPPFLESIVTFTIIPNTSGGTHLRIVHELTDKRLYRTKKQAANNNGSPLMLAA
ncbi:SRPBCC domain-containing protein [Brucella sp. HL-2]|nr:SRPBCC domain-containing protein [Brucella sp. HL-2]MCV9909718.1 SRPBCC domain-containing protein [Brucella sp. HL-2]